MIWIYLLIGLAAAISITLTHLNAAQGWRFWINTAAVVVVWLPAMLIIAYWWWRVTSEAGEAE